MAFRGVIALLALTACEVPQDTRFTLDLRTREVDLVDDGAMLHVTGCLSGIVGGCTPPGAGDAMAVTLDGSVHGVPFHPEAPPADPNEIIILDGGGNRFRLATASPADPHVGIGLAGEAAHVEIPRLFEITPQPDHVSRAIGSLILFHEVLPGGRTSASATTTCGSDTYRENISDRPAGRLRIDLLGFVSGTCTHEVVVTQAVDFPRDTTLLGCTARAETIRFTSEP